MNNALWHIDHCKGPFERIVDVGAYIGEFSMAADDRGAKVIYAFEPNAENFTQLDNNLAGITARVYLHRIAIVGNKPGLYRLYLSGPTSNIQSSEQFGVVTMPFLEMIKMLAPIDYLKIDIEGMEHEIFDNHRLEMADAMKEVGFLQLEIHKTSNLWNGMLDDAEYFRRIKDMIEILDYYGFRDKPCEVREIHPGDFCSHNHLYSRGFVQMAV